MCFVEMCAFVILSKSICIFTKHGISLQAGFHFHYVCHLPSRPDTRAFLCVRQVADEAAVRQLLELGITDNETLVRQALRVSDGNIDHAVEFIYASMQ